MALTTLRSVVTRTLATSRKLVNGYAVCQPAVLQLPEHLSWVPCQRQALWSHAKPLAHGFAFGTKPMRGRPANDRWALQAGRPDARRTVPGSRLARAARLHLTLRGQGHSSRIAVPCGWSARERGFRIAI